MLIHFPSALLPMEFVCYGFHYYTKDASFLFAAFYALAGAVGIGWIAIVAGIWDATRIRPEKAEAIAKAVTHGAINLSVIVAYTVLAYIAYKKYPLLPGATLTLLAFKGLLILTLVVGNYLGGSLILKNKIAVEE